ncbi:MAG TPA: heme A synthase [Cryomorphaceae bacterium]|nr:heme A synthase [Cryomorphaceae bacterium]
MPHSPTTKWTAVLRRLLQASILLTLLVILAGSVVRMTGSGMGCPDWPTCFGLIVPPTQESQVTFQPSTLYEPGQMIVRNDTLWVARETIISSGRDFNPAQWEAYTRHDYAVFNPVHTWIEYINRLLGALLGLPVVLATVWIFWRVKSHPKWAFTMLGALLLLGFEAWLGKVVVDGNLVPHQITYHMAGAFLLLALLTAVYRSVSSEWELHALRAETQREGLEAERQKAYRLFLILIGLLAVQIVMGTQVREEVDVLIKAFGLEADRSSWIAQLPAGLLVHRSFSLLILGVSYGLYRKSFGLGGLKVRAAGVLYILLLETALGAAMYYFAIPRFMQPMHLLLSAIAWFLLVDGAFKAWLMLRKV